MTRQELITAIARETGMERAAVDAIVICAMNCIKRSLSEGEPVYLRGFGTFLNKVRKAKVGRNITAKTSIVIPEHTVPAFRPSKSFKAEVR